MSFSITRKEKKVLVDALKAYSNEKDKGEVDSLIQKFQNSIEVEYTTNKFKVPPELDLRRKLRMGDIDLIRQMRESGETYTAIAKHFGISQPYVFFLCNEYAMKRNKENNKIYCKGRYDKKAVERCKKRKVKLGLENKLIEKGAPYVNGN